MKKLFFLIILLTFSVTSSAQYFEWGKTFGEPNQDIQKGVVLDNMGNVYTTGTFTGTLDIDPGPGVTNITSSGGINTYIQKLDSLGNLIWYGKIGGPGTGYSTDIALDAANNIYIYGTFTGTCDFHPGAPIINVVATNPGLYDGFILKLDNAGNYSWIKHFGGTGLASVTSGHLKISPSGFIYMMGSYSATVDFDAAGGITTLTSLGNEDNFVLKYAISGNFIWAKGFGNSGGDEVNDIAINTSENVFLTGSFINTVDFDPGAASYPITSSGNKDIYIEKLDSAGNFIWAKSMGVGLDDDGYTIAVDDSGNVFTSGIFISTVDFDPNAGIFNLTSSGSDIFIQKLNAAGNLVWAKRIGGGAGNLLPAAIKLDSNGSIFLAGTFNGSAVDFDPGIGIANLVCDPSGSDNFVCKLDALGNYIWAVNTTNSNSSAGDRIFSMNLSSTGAILIAGYYSGSADFNPASGTYPSASVSSSLDAFLIKLSQDACSHMGLFVDSIHASSCLASGYGAGHGFGGQTPYSYIWNSTPAVLDSFASLPSGVWQLTVTDANSCVRTNSVLLDGPIPFASFDLDANMIVPGFRPGYPSTILLDAFNNTCTIAPGVLSLIIPSGILFSSSTPTPSSIIGDTLFWNFNPIDYDSTHFRTFVHIITSSAVPIGSLLCFTLKIDPTVGDSYTSNNLKSYCYHAVSSYDPNIKSVNPEGNCSNGYIPNTQKLTYTVQFQNTGTADAINIFVLDTLNPNLDLSTVRVVGKSHSLITEVLPGNVLKFRFDSINLPDSTSNEPLSHGYVIFDVMPNPSLANGTQITNDVGIYFDFNPPVYTNVVLNTISDGIFNATTTVSGVTITASQSGMNYQWINCDMGNSPIAGAIAQNYTPSVNGNYSVYVSDGCLSDTSSCVGIFTTGITNLDLANFYAFPNPAQNSISISSPVPTEISILNLLGEVVLITKVESKKVIDISHFSKGIYFIRNKEGEITKLIKQ